MLRDDACLEYSRYGNPGGICESPRLSWFINPSKQIPGAWLVGWRQRALTEVQVDGFGTEHACGTGRGHSHYYGSVCNARGTTKKCLLFCSVFPWSQAITLNERGTIIGTQPGLVWYFVQSVRSVCESSSLSTTDQYVLMITAFLAHFWLEVWFLCGEGWFYWTIYLAI